MINHFRLNWAKIKHDISLYKWALQYISAYWKRIVLASILTIIMSLSNGLATYSILPIMQIALNETRLETENVEDSIISNPSTDSINTSGLVALLDSLYQKIIPEGTQLTRLVAFAIIALSLLILTNALHTIIDFLFITIQANGVKQIRSSTFSKLSGLAINYFNKSKSGEITSKVTTDLGGSIGMVTGSLSSILRNLLMICVFLVLLFGTSIILSLIAFPIILIALLASSILANWMRKLQTNLLESSASIIVVMQEFLAGIRIIKAFGKEDYEISKWEEQIEWWKNLEIKHVMAKSLIPHGISFSLALAIGAIFITGSILVMDNQLGIGQLILFAILIQRIQSPATGLLQGYAIIQNGLAHSERSHSIFHGAQTEKDGNLKIDGIKDGVTLKNVFFDYGEGNIIHDLTLKLPVNTVTAIVGTSGGGKSTIADLIIRFHHPTHGEITLDGTNIKKFNLNQYRSLFGVVTQETFLFHDSIKNNIAYSVENIDEEKIVGAAKIANAHHFISQLPEGYETLVGDRGVRLSGGERQRIAIARAIMKNPPILILDEATSALDIESEQKVQEAINRIIKGRTVLVIAHRLSTIRSADNIAVLDKGTIIESGTHEQLMIKTGQYKRIYDMQFKSTGVEELTLSKD